MPKTVGAVGGALVTGGAAAVQGIAMLNPQRWAGGDMPANRSDEYSKTLVGTETTFYERAEENDNSRTFSFSS